MKLRDKLYSRSIIPVNIHSTVRDILKLVVPGT